MVLTIQLLWDVVSLGEWSTTLRRIHFEESGGETGNIMPSSWMIKGPQKFLWSFGTLWHLKIDALYFSETSETTHQTPRHRISEILISHKQRHENLNCRMGNNITIILYIVFILIYYIDYCSTGAIVLQQYGIGTPGVLNCDIRTIFLFWIQRCNILQTF